MPWLDEEIHSYPHVAKLNAEGGRVRDAKRGFELFVPPGALKFHDVRYVRVDLVDLAKALPPKSPGDVFEKVSQRFDPVDDRSAYEITTSEDGVDFESAPSFEKPVEITLAHRKLSGSHVYKIECCGAVDPAAWRPRDAAPWGERVTEGVCALSLSTRQPGRPYNKKGGPVTRYFVIGAVKN